MSEASVFKLSEIPMKRPVVLASALRHLDQAALERSLGRTYPPGRLRRLLEVAVSAGRVRSARAEVPQKGVRRFVDLETLAGEFEAFLRETPADGTGPRGAAKDDDAGNPTLRQSLVRYVARRPRLRGVAERLGFRPAHWVELALASTFAPIQVFEEICGLLDVVAGLRPRSVLEVGSSRGGTLYLFTKVAHPEACLMSVDLRIPDPGLLRSFARGRERVIPYQGDSGAPSTIATVRDTFRDGIDFLFLDGDHSYEGVKRDFETYAPLVKQGGVIALHDIVEDNLARYGVITGGWSGGVPRFWNEVKQAYEHREFVRDRAQDACGIGVVFIASRAAVRHAKVTAPRG